MMTKTEEILKETGLSSSDELCRAGFDLDDWNVCFASDVRLIEGGEEFDEDGYPVYEPEPIDEAFWLVMRMEEYCVGYNEVECNGKWYYTVHHA